MPNDQFSEERGRALLAQAFKQCDIPERTGDEYPPRLFGGNVYSEITDNDIGIVFSYYHPGAGPVYCTVSLRQIAFQTAQQFKNDDEAIEALVDTLKYLESAVSGLMPTAQHKLLRRAFNLSVRPKADKDQQKGWLTILEQLAPSDTRTETERKLAAERDWRTSKPTRLTKSELADLHVEYDDLFEIAKSLKKDHDAAFSKFDKAHSRNGYKREQWEAFWLAYCSQLYEHDPEFLSLFASADEPSAAEITYRYLAAKKRHSRSYMERLVLKSRKDAGKAKRFKKTDKENPS